MTRLVILCLLTGAGSVGAQIPSPAAKGATISGLVRDSASHLPLANVRVLIRVAPGGSLVAEAKTDARGLFLAGAIADGIYDVDTQKSGFIPALAAGSRSRPLRITGGNSVKDAVFEPQPSSSLAGRIVPTAEMPDGLKAYALQPIVSGDTSSMRIVAAAEIDDRGQFRLDALEPRTYVVAIVPRPLAEGRQTRLPLYHPGTLRAAAATRIHLTRGSTIEDLAIAFPPQPGGNNISGKLSGRVQGTAVVTLYSDSFPLPLASARADGEGNFVLRNIPSGEYTMVAVDSVTGWGESTLVVADGQSAGIRTISLNGADFTDVELTLHEPVSLRLRQRGCDSAGQIHLEPIRPLPYRPATAFADASGSVSLPMLRGVRYFLQFENSFGCPIRGPEAR